MVGGEAKKISPDFSDLHPEFGAGMPLGIQIIWDTAH
jgi:hypothetical protein